MLVFYITAPHTIRRVMRGIVCAWKEGGYRPCFLAPHESVWAIPGTLAN